MCTIMYKPEDIRLNNFPTRAEEIIQVNIEGEYIMLHSVALHVCCATRTERALEFIV